MTTVELEKEMARIQRSTRTTFSRFSPWHDWLRMRSKLYYRWHLSRLFSPIHWAVLSLFIAAVATFGFLSFYPGHFQNPPEAEAAASWSQVSPNDGLTYTSSVSNNNDLYVGYYGPSYSDNSGGVKKWDGSSWSQVGSALGDGIFGIVVYNNELYISGSQLVGGMYGYDSSYFAKWSGSSWTELSESGGTLSELTVYNDELYGIVSSTGGRAVSNVVKWSGSSWSQVGSFPGYGLSNAGGILSVYNGGLYAAGNYGIQGNYTNGVFSWDGTSWSQVIGSEGISGIYGLAAYNNKLYVASSDVGVFSWDGTSWSQVGSESPGANRRLIANVLAVYNGELYAGVNYAVNKWDGSSWSQVGQTFSFNLDSFAVNNNVLYFLANGSVYELTGDVPAAPTIGAPEPISNNTIRWHFTDNSGNETGFKVYDGSNNLVATCASANLSYCDETGLSTNLRYTGRYVVAYNSYGNSNPSATAAATYTLTNLPNNLSTTFWTTSSINWSWGSNSNPAGTEFYASDSAGNSGWTTATTWNQYQDHLLPNTKYTLSVKSRNFDSVEKSPPVTLDAYTGIEAPSDIIYSNVSEGSITLTAIGSLDNLTDGNSGIRFCNTTTSVCSDWQNSSTSYSFGSLSAGTQYSFTAESRNGDAISGGTFGSSYTIPNNPPGPTPAPTPGPTPTPAPPTKCSNDVPLDFCPINTVPYNSGYDNTNKCTIWKCTSDHGNNCPASEINVYLLGQIINDDNKNNQTFGSSGFNNSYSPNGLISPVDTINVKPGQEITITATSGVKFDGHSITEWDNKQHNDSGPLITADPKAGSFISAIGFPSVFGWSAYQTIGDTLKNSQITTFKVTDIAGTYNTALETSCAFRVGNCSSSASARINIIVGNDSDGGGGENGGSGSGGGNGSAGMAAAPTAGILKNAIDGVVNFAESVGKLVARNPILTAATAAISAGLALALAPLSNAISLYSLPELTHVFNYLFIPAAIIRRKKNKWGKVIEDGTGAALPSVFVSLLSVEDDGSEKVIENSYTDKSGSYGFTATPGRYKVVAKKNGYSIASQSDQYYGYNPNKIYTIESYDDGLIVPTIILSITGKKITSVYRTLIFFKKMEKILNYVSILILVIGTIMIIKAILSDRSILNSIVLCGYALLWALNISLLLRHSPWSRVIDENTGVALSLALVRITDKKSNKLVRTTVTDNDGRFSAILRKGKYEVSVSKEDYKLDQPVTFNVSGDLSTISRTIKLERKTPAEV